MLARLCLAAARRLRPHPELALGMEAGQVVCPDRGLMDVEDCFICSRFRGLDGDRIACVAASRGLVPAIGGRAIR